MGVLFSPFAFAYTAALVVFIIAGLTDLLDGRIARGKNLYSDFGTLMDPLADKILISTAFISFVELRETRVAAWMVVLIIAREFLITGLRLLALNKGVLVKAGDWGKHKTFSQIFAICLILSFHAAKEFLVRTPQRWAGCQGGFHALYNTVVFWTMLIVVGLTLLSGFFYVLENRQVFEGAEGRVKA